MLEVSLGVVGCFVGRAVVGSLAARRAFRLGTSVPIEAPIALDLARHHRMVWSAISGACAVLIIVVGAIGLDQVWITGALTLGIAAGTTAVRADYMLCAIDHPDVRLTIADGVVHGSIDDAIIGWVRASPALITRIASRYLPTARLRR